MTIAFVASTVLFFVGLVAAPLIVARLPVDYFSQSRVSRPAPARGRWGWIIMRVLRNVLGFALLLSGTAMLVLPGQGILTIIAGVLLLDFPAKRSFLYRLYRTARVRRSLNWMRRKMGKEPFAS